MNVAFSLALVVLLILPGLLLRGAYLRGPRFRRSKHRTGARPYVGGPFLYELGVGVLLSMPIHLLAAWIAGRMGHAIDFGVVIAALVGYWGTDGYFFRQLIIAVRDGFDGIAAYFALVNGGALLLGLLARWLVRASRLDTKHSRFRFHDEWHYLLSGEGSHAEPDLVMASATVVQGSRTCQYQGAVEDFAVRRDGRLDRLILTGARRREIGADGNPDLFYEPEGDLLILAADDIRALNLEYLRIAAEDEG